MKNERFENRQIEIERKFLVDTERLPGLAEDFEQTKIRQGYMVLGADGSEARVRDKGGVFSLTVKSKGDRTRGEWEIEIDEEQFLTLWPATEGKRVEKIRIKVPYEGHIIEVDVYEGYLYGLVTAEVEFDSDNEALEFVAPDWLKEDVTEVAAYKNQNLACRNFH